MIGRVTQQMTAGNLLANINQALDRLDTTQQELSTGKRINQPSDDPYGTSIALELNNQIANLTSYSNSVTDGTGWTQTSNAALTNITDAVQRIRELTVGAANGTQTQADLQATGAEVNQLIDEIKQDANTQYNGQYVFAGSATGTQPYQSGSGDAYAGDTGQVTRTIGPNTSLSINANLSTVLGTGQTHVGSAGRRRPVAEHAAQHRRRHAVGQLERARRHRSLAARHEPELAHRSHRQHRRDQRPTEHGRLAHPVAPGERHAVAVQHAGRRHGPDRDQLLDPAGGPDRGFASRRQHRAAVADGLPQRLEFARLVSSLTIESSRFGHVEIDSASVLEFPEGLIGLGGSRYALIAADPDAPFLWLQSLEDPSLALPLTNPHRFFADFAVEVIDEDAERLGLDATGAMDVYVTVRAAPGARGLHRQPEGAHPGARRPGLAGDQPGARLRASGPAVRGGRGGRRRGVRRRRMLRISRRAGERIMLGDNVVIEVLEVRGQTVRIGIDAPRVDPGLPGGDLARGQAREPGCRGGGGSAELPDVSGRLRPSQRPIAYATSENSGSSTSSSARSFLVICPWIWQTRLSVTPRISPISRRVRL